MSFRDVKRGFSDRETRVLACINQKGGVGKSTTVINLSASLSELKKKVLIVDFDPQGNASSGFGIEKEELEHDIYDSVLHEYPIEDIIQDTVCKSVFVAPATIQLAGAEIELVSKMSREQCLKKALTPIKNEFDYIIIDCPPSLGLLTINALCAADSLLIPIQCEYYALEGVTKILESMKMVQKSINPELEVFGVVLTMFDTRTSLSKQVEDEVRAFFGTKCFKTTIPRNVKIAEAPSYGQPISVYARVSKGALAYGRLAKEVTRRG
ncbi:AAA family ATPase [Paratractidigestivibacter sp.]|uniref:ParA family protein n=1 Tax=Paratractidigestivibacter sp. TaxID=2847316 RepID=UPI002ACB09B7|nr:AAA family ATPase [Paratractidigestivibacter sp.]